MSEQEQSLVGGKAQQEVGLQMQEIIDHRSTQKWTPTTETCLQ